MSTPSEKAADRMYADLEAMEADAKRHMDAAKGDDHNDWKMLWRTVRGARAAAMKVMSERDRRLAERG